MAQNDRDELIAAVAKLKSIDVPSAIRPYVTVVIAETEEDLASRTMGPRRGRSVFELYGGVLRMYPEVEESKRALFWLERVRDITVRLPDYFPWRFALQSDALLPIRDDAGALRGEDSRRWAGGSWKVCLVEKPLGGDSLGPFVAPVLDALSPEGWWLIDRRERTIPLLGLGDPHFLEGRSGEFCLLKISPGNEELARRFTPLNPSFNKEVHLLAVSGQPKPSFFKALVSLIDDASSDVPDLTVAEAVLREIWQSPSRELAAHFENGRFFVAASTGYAPRRLWVTEGANG